jgi:hypothetical protein
VVVAMATTVVVVDTSVVVDSGSVVVLVVVVEVGLVEVDDAGDAIVVELPTVVPGEAAEQDATRTTANNAVGRANDRIRTSKDRISVSRIQYQPGTMAVATFTSHERTRACCSPAQFPCDRARRIGTAI